MDKNAVWKWAILVVLVFGSFMVVWPPSEKITLGLDLRGGTSFTLEIDQGVLSKQIKEEAGNLSPAELEKKLLSARDQGVERALEVIHNRINGLGISEPVIYPERSTGRIIVQLPGVDDKKREEAIDQLKRVAYLTFRMVHEENTKLVDDLFDKKLAPEGYIIVEATKYERAMNFYQRDTNAIPESAIDDSYRDRLKKFNAPPGYDFMLERANASGRELFTPVFVSIRKELTGDMLKSAGNEIDPLTGKQEVLLEFKAAGARKFERVTTDYGPRGAKNPSDQGRQFAIVLDSTLYSAPVIKEPIPSGHARITGDFTAQEAARLSNVLRAGALPAPIKIMETRVVDATLGEDSVRSGIGAGIWGCVAIIIMMACYYLANGLIADIALILNVVLLPLGAIVVAGFLGMFFGGLQGGKVGLPVLTLPGIAGIALSIGMAVDANVLIFERMREELRAGKGYLAAVDAGFDRAFSAIFDSNMTTIITAIIMFAVGSGPVRGYAITLTAGLIINLYSAVFVSRMCYDAIGSRWQSTKILKMFSMIGETSLDFISKWKIALGTSVALIIVSWVLMFAHGSKNLSSVFAVDFQGGTSLMMSYQQEADVEAVRKAFSQGGINATPQYQRGMGVTGQSVLQVTVANAEEGKTVKTILSEKFPKSSFTVIKQDDVGPQVGKELKSKALWALGIAVAAMIVYIAFRFEFGFGLGAIVAIVHDVMMTIGICHLFGFQLNMTIMAGVLTIIGYSVNDTIVIFDRIRENLRLIRNKSFVEICNLSVNQTLSRTLLTNSYTLVSVLFLLLMGGGAIKDFSFAMLVGMIAGTYSTVYIATPVVLLWHKFERPALGK